MESGLLTRFYSLVADVLSQILGVSHQYGIFVPRLDPSARRPPLCFVSTDADREAGAPRFASG